MHRRINLWSGPRNISTALMYSFAQRHDTKVFDEPLYAHYLKTTGIIHPGTADILRSQENDGEKIVASLILGYNEEPVLFFKQMTHHLIDLDMEFLEKTYNILLIRDPKNVLNSYSKVIEKPTLEDIGIKQSFELFSFLESKGYHYFIIDSAQILKDPETALTKICSACDIQFDKAMLKWEKAARPEDGIWAKYWYANVHNSTGFQTYQEETIDLPDHLNPIYLQAKVYYDALIRHTIKI